MEERNMRKTYAYNSIIIGVLVGLLVGVSTENIVLAILALLGISIVGFVVIRFLEKLLWKALNKGVDAATDAAGKAYRNYKARKDEQK